VNAEELRVHRELEYLRQAGKEARARTGVGRGRKKHYRQTARRHHQRSLVVRAQKLADTP
jgi:hypothetical protein